MEGDVEALRKELEVFLRGRYEREFMSQANEFMQKVVFRGNYDADFKEFLKDKGFWLFKLFAQLLASPSFLKLQINKAWGTFGCVEDKVANSAL